MPLFASFFEATTSSTEAFVELTENFLLSMPSLDDAGWSGYYFWQNVSYFSLMYLLPNGDTTKGNSTLGVWTKKAATIPGVAIKTDATTTYTGFNDWLIANIMQPDHVVGYNYTQNGHFGIGLNVASWFLPRNLLTDGKATHTLAESMAAIPIGGGQ